MRIHSLIHERGQRGFTLVEMMVAVVILAVVAGAAFLVLNSSATAKRTGDHVAEAQQNARAALNAIVADLRQTGYGVLTGGGIPPIEVASDDRMTFVMDRDRDGVIEAGERVTYFIDPDQSQMLAANTDNPFDYVIRRVESTAGDPSATPATGAGRVVAYMITQRSGLAATARDVPVFEYYDANDVLFAGVGTDPAGSDYGLTLPDSILGLPAGSGLDLLVERIDVNLVTETPVVEGNDKNYRRFAISAQIHPRNFAYELVSNFEVILSDPTGTPTDTTGTGPVDTTGTDTTTVPVLPPYEPPIRISTARVLSLDAKDLGELDSKEGSNTTIDYQGDFDIVLGTKAGTSNNLSVWLNGQPGKYSPGTFYSSTPNYYGNSSFDLQDIVVANIDMSSSDYPDAICAVKETDVRGGFQVWLNQEAGNPGYIGQDAGPTRPTSYYSNGSGQGRAIGVADFDRDGDRDVVLGTVINENQGAVEIWLNDGYGDFTFGAALTASGEVNSITVFDMDRDGWLEFAAGTKTTSSGNNGRIDVYKNTGSASFYRFASYESGGQVKVIRAGNLNQDSHTDLVVGTRTSQNQGTVEFWKGSGGGFVLTDKVTADAEVLSLGLGEINLGDVSPDVVAGTNKGSIQSWFTDPGGSDNVLSDIESWSDANTGGQVQALEIVKVEKGQYTFFEDPLFDIIAGTAVSTTEGEIVLYLNPYVWTLQQ